MIEFLPCIERSFLKRSIRRSQLALSARGWGPYVRMMPILRYRSSAMRRASVSLTDSVWRTCWTATLTSPSQMGLMGIEVEVAWGRGWGGKTLDQLREVHQQCGNSGMLIGSPERLPNFPSKDIDLACAAVEG